MDGCNIDHVADEYDVLVRSDGTEVTILTEPEDRYPHRDIAPITAELNTLATELAAKGEALRIATEALKRIKDVGNLPSAWGIAEEALGGNDASE